MKTRTVGAETTYAKSVRSFDHSALAQLDAYPALRQAISDVANQAERMELTDFLAAVRDMALTAPYADCCDRCRRAGAETNLSWPHAVERNARGWLTCTYRCGRCGHIWTCGYAADFPEFAW